MTCGVRQGEALALLAGRQQQRPSRGRLADADRRDRASGCTAWCRRSRGPAVTTPPGRVDVEGDVLVRVLALQEQQLGADQRRHLVVDRAGQEDDPLLQQARIDVVGALAAGGLLDHHGHEGVVVDLDRIAVVKTARDIMLCPLRRRRGASPMAPPEAARPGLRRNAAARLPSPTMCQVRKMGYPAPAWPSRAGAGFRRPGAPPGVTVVSVTLASSSMKSTTFSSKSGRADVLDRLRVLLEELQHLPLLARVAQRLGAHRLGDLVLRRPGSPLVRPISASSRPRRMRRSAMRAVLGPQRLLVLARVLGVQAAGLPVGLDPCPDLAELGLHHALGHREVGPVGELVQQLALHLIRVSWSYSRWMEARSSLPQLLQRSRGRGTWRSRRPPARRRGSSAPWPSSRTRPACRPARPCA